MGILGRLVEAAVDANEEAHGVRLQRGLEDTKRCLALLRQDVRAESVLAFAVRRRDLLQQIPNWSPDGRLKAGRKLQSEARAKFDFNQSESYALWMTGAWLESGIRVSLKARAVFDSLEALALDVEGYQPQSVMPRPGAAGTHASADKARQLARMIWSFDEGWERTIKVACEKSGMQDRRAGDKYLAIVWGATHGLGEWFGADQNIKAAALLIVFEEAPNRADLYKRLVAISMDPSWGTWIGLGAQAVNSHMSGAADPVVAYMPLALRYLSSDGG